MSPGLWVRILPGISQALAAVLLFGLGTSAHAEMALNMPPGVTEISREVYDLHMRIFYICCIIALVVFGAMIWSIFHHRKSRGAVAAHFHHSTAVEIIWTIVPFLILVGMAIPAASTLIKMEDTRQADMTIKITGYQWKWHYDYLGEGVDFYSTLDAQSNLARQVGSDIDLTTVDNYLLEVDNALVVPINQRIRIVLTAADVIHAWWVPELAVKKDAIPGFVNETWMKIDEPGTYRGQCAELCGRDHGFMPVVVIAKTEKEYAAWLAEQKGETAPADAAAAKAADSASSSQPAAAPAPVAAKPAAAVAAATPAPAVPVITPKPVAAVTAPPPPAAAAPAVAAVSPMATAMARGKKVYTTHCSHCHQPDGKGIANVFPTLAGSAIATKDKPKHISVVLNGVKNTAMLGYLGQLSEGDLAAVITYERNAWGNNTGDIVSADDIKAAR